MTRARRLVDAVVQERLSQIPGWSLKDGKLHREFKFANFVEAFAFMTASALEAEKLNHHPEWSNVWATVKVDLTTHHAQGITDLDFELASRMEVHARTNGEA
ncbi:MAG: 4a-hydroxytetrahydrobiopterin dehydratase [Candidatus Methylacidiphilales bacterium]|nr:4a-hydroxytetrahydrobiopterin dehydratase [Candidatus Methylacidiphilales bacterium]